MIYNSTSFCILSSILLFAGTTIIAKAQAPVNVQWVIEKNSTLAVEGKSNVNSFTCNIKGYTKKDTIVCVSGPSGSIELEGEMKMDVLSFDCHSAMITKNLRKTLKAKDYPKMTIRFLSLRGMPLLNNRPELIKGWVEVELAGIVKRLELDYSFSRALPGYIQLTGDRNFRFSDFQLSPPKKLGGLVKVRDNFNVNFQLILRSI